MQGEDDKLSECGMSGGVGADLADINNHCEVGNNHCEVGFINSEPSLQEFIHGPLENNTPPPPGNS